MFNSPQPKKKGMKQVANPTVRIENQTLYSSRMEKFWADFKRNWQLHLMICLPMFYLILFNYVPMYGIQVAFKKFSPRAGIWGSEWIGLKNFEKFFGYYLWKEVVINTVALSSYSLIVGWAPPVILALAIHINTHKVFTKITQRISYMPHFISVVVLVGMINTVLNPVTGFMGYFIRLFDIKGYVDIRGSKDAFRHLFVWTGEWQGVGWGSIIYVSALSAVPTELHEAAKIDGASRLRRVWSVDLPTIIPMMALLFIMSSGSILNVGYQKAYLMGNAMNHEVSEIISTYVYKNGIRSGDASFGSAVGLLQSVINTAIVFFVNWIADLLSDGEYAMF